MNTITLSRNTPKKLKADWELFVLKTLLSTKFFYLNKISI